MKEYRERTDLTVIEIVQPLDIKTSVSKDHRKMSYLDFSLYLPFLTRNKFATYQIPQPHQLVTARIGIIF